MGDEVSKQTLHLLLAVHVFFLTVTEKEQGACRETVKGQWRRRCSDLSSGSFNDESFISVIEPKMTKMWRFQPLMCEDVLSLTNLQLNIFCF